MYLCKMQDKNKKQPCARMKCKKSCPNCQKRFWWPSMDLCINVKCQTTQLCKSFVKIKILTPWAAQVISSILRSQIRVIQISREHILWAIWGILVTTKLTSLWLNFPISCSFFINLINRSAIWIFDMWQLSWYYKYD